MSSQNSTELLAKLEAQRKLLLDLGGRNKLINFKHSGPTSRSKKQNYLRIADEVPEIILKKLDQQSRLQLIAKPPENAYEVDLTLLTDISTLSSQHSDDFIQVIEEEPVFSLSCEKLRSENRLSLQERGINTLNIAIGFLHWYESRGSIGTEERFSPLVLLPVQISREKSTNGYIYFVDGGEDDPSINISLWRKLSEDEGLQLPALSVDEEGQPQLSEFFDELKVLLSERNENHSGQPWHLKQWATLGLFSFTNISIYNDLDFSCWDEDPLSSNSFLSDFIQGTPSASIEPMGELSSSQDEDEQSLTAFEVPKLISDADSTQYAVIKKSIQGYNLVVQGPPGTGKSQTITNMIACLLDSGKRVLFAADKLAALEVVKNRLSEKGLEEFCLEMHNAGCSKLKLHQEIKRRIDYQVEKYSQKNYSQSLEQLKTLRTELNDHSGLLNKTLSTSFGDTSIHDSIWKLVSNKLAVADESELFALSRAQEINVDVITPALLERATDELDQLSQTSQLLSDCGLQNISTIVGLPVTESELASLLDALHNLRVDYELLLQESNQERLTISELTDEYYQFLLDQLSTVEKLSESFGVAPDVPINESFATNLSEALRLIKTRESVQDHIPSWTYPLLGESKRFSQLQDCLIAIDNLVKDEKNIDSVQHFQDLLRDSFDFCRATGRLLSRMDRAITEKLCYGDTAACIDFSRSASAIPIQIAAQVIAHSESSQHVSSCYAALLEIKRNSNLATELTGLGVEVSSLGEVDALRFRDSVQSIRDTGPLGCIVDAKVRSAKLLWKLVSNSQTKRPALPQLAKIYSKCSEYIRRSSEEEALINEVLPLEKLRDLSSQLDSADDHECDLVQFYGSLDDPKLAASALELLATISESISVPELICLSARTLQEAEKVSGASLASIGSKISLLGEGIRDSISALDPYDLSLLARDLSAFKDAVDSLYQFLISNNIFSDKDLSFSLSGSNIESLLSTFNDIKFSSLPPAISESLSSYGVSATCSALRKNLACFSRKDSLNTISSTAPIADFLSANSVENFLSDVTVADAFSTLLSLTDKAVSFQPEILKYLRVVSSLSQKGISKGVAEVVKLSVESGLPPRRILTVAIASMQSRELQLEAQISTLSGASVNSLRELFREVDEDFILDSSKALAASLCAGTKNALLPGTSTGSPRLFTEGPLIQHEIRKQRRHLPTRLLVKQAFESLSRLKPCWMMSPASAAELLPKRPALFDVLVIDEASQMKPEQAFSLIARAKQVIIVGDRNQLPPTNFFQKRDLVSDEDEVDVEIEDNESILELADKVLAANGCSLGWHYRSRHQSLISFSNYYFYENSLTIFASNKVDSQVNLVQVENPLYSGGINLSEVEQVIQVLKRQISAEPDRTILVATMNQAQTSELKMALEREIQNDPLLEKFSSTHQSTLDELVVKNLENVQGDERDVVIISTVYGPGSDGRVMQNFGPINKDSGWRRLNVLFTRAKHKVIVVSSLMPSDISITENSSRGVRALRGYLDFALSGSIADDLQRSGGEVESPFEDSVRNSLVSLGHQVDLQVGVASYRIDMAIRDPRDPSRYLLAIECDGASYHSSFSARSRDRLRQQVLEGLGWKVYRVWSTDWFRDPQRELNLLDTYIRDLLS
ncbi:DUF4011 domain-containing protein [Synechococcus sp. WH 8016]|uniref:DUF4011 domain-containing protein n=1 Tax=Synechococcus sp. WH 8016 TaxID=166318 RepID=UPI00022D9EBD|nr:DUF4011 domain-containing protein [Synechococcus sp. WH 8016]EHA60517.1 RAP domain protein [Synechococcus sp. WH 8016]